MADLVSSIKKGIQGINNKDVGLNLDVVLKTNADWFLLYSGKGTGKSYAIRERALNKFMQHSDELLIVRRRDIDTKPSNIRKYFEKVDIEKLTNGKYNNVMVKSNEIFFSYIDENYKEHKGARLGHYIPMSVFERFKGCDYPKVSTIIYEEFISESGDYILDESTTFMKLINTIYRPLTKAEYNTLTKEEKDRQTRHEVWLVGNTISRLCPYFRDYNLQNILRQEKNTIDIYTYSYPNEIDELTDKPKEVKLACWYIGENDKGNKKNHGFIFGKGYDTIVKGDWQTDIYPKLEHQYNEYNKIYEFLVLDDMKYCVQLLRYKDLYTLYVYPYTSKRDSIKRKITKEYNISRYVSNKLLKEIEIEKFIAYLLDLNKVVYSDNLTGTEFQNYKKRLIIGL